jgi:hypothetical protein
VLVSDPEVDLPVVVPSSAVVAPESSTAVSSQVAASSAPAGVAVVSEAKTSDGVETAVAKSEVTVASTAPSVVASTAASVVASVATVVATVAETVVNPLVPAVVEAVLPTANTTDVASASQNPVAEAASAVTKAAFSLGGGQSNSPLAPYEPWSMKSILSVSAILGSTVAGLAYFMKHMSAFLPKL